jgi:hypothetical protein
MAIIRTQLVSGQRRIITKVVSGQRRVSCSCCPSDVECCMYPADQIGISYTANDLPDEILFATVGSEGNFITATRDGTNFVMQDLFAPGEDVVVGLNNGSWQLWVEAGFGPDFIIGDYSENCLINWPSAPFDKIPAIADNFADTYYFSDGPTNANNIALNRISLCVWESEEWLSYASFGGSQTDYYGQAVLKYVENIKTYYSGASWDSLNPPEKNGFVFEIAEYVSGGLIGYKENPQNKPDGTYIGATTPTIGRNVVITE